MHYVYGVVYSPLQVDSDWESMTASDIRKMAHDFIASGKAGQIDMYHETVPCGAEVVESFIARKDDPDFPEGAWVLGVRVEEGPVWDLIRKGELNGFSVDAFVSKVPKKVMVDLVQICMGDTELNVDIENVRPHTHQFYVEFDSQGRVSAGYTDEVEGHTHLIYGTVVTESADGHNHRFTVE